MVHQDNKNIYAIRVAPNSSVTADSSEEVEVNKKVFENNSESYLELQHCRRKLDIWEIQKEGIDQTSDKITMPNKLSNCYFSI